MTHSSPVFDLSTNEGPAGTPPSFTARGTTTWQDLSRNDPIVFFIPTTAVPLDVVVSMELANEVARGKKWADARWDSRLSLANNQSDY